MSQTKIVAALGLSVAFSCALLTATSQAQTTGPCATSVNCWADLLSYRPPLDVQAALAQRPLSGRGWYAHRIEAGAGPVNLDFYSVHIDVFPTINGKKLSKDDLFNVIRTDFAKFLPPTSVTTFAPVSAAIDGPLWDSAAPVGSVMQFVLSYLHVPDFERAAVVTSSHTQTSWKFSTVYATPTYAHPVSGTREFGIYQLADGAYRVYTRGADRATSQYVDYIGGELLAPIMQTLLKNLNANDLADAAPSLFDGGDKVWRGFQQLLVSFINANGGQAQIEGPSILRPAWDSADVVDAYKPNTSWQTTYVFMPLQAPMATATACTGIGDDGTVIGTFVRNGARAFAVRDSDGDGAYSSTEFVELGGLGGVATPLAVSDGEIVGFITNSQGDPQASIWDLTGAPTQVQVPGSVAARFVDISRGAILGDFQFESTANPQFVLLWRPFLWKRFFGDTAFDNQKAVYPPASPNGAEAVAMTTQGTAVLNVMMSDGSQRAHLWKGTNLTSLGGLIPNGSLTAEAITDDEVVVGWGDGSSGTRGFSWRAGKLIELSTLGGNRSHASGIDREGVVFGGARLGNGTQVPAAWARASPSNMLASMSTPQGWLLTTALRAGIGGRVIFQAKIGNTTACGIGFPMP